MDKKIGMVWGIGYVVMIIFLLFYISVLVKGETTFSSSNRETSTIDGYVYHLLYDEDFSDINCQYTWATIGNFPTYNSNTIEFNGQTNYISCLRSRKIIYADNPIDSSLPHCTIILKFRVRSAGDSFTIFSDNEIVVMYGISSDTDKIYTKYIESGTPSTMEVIASATTNDWYTFTLIKYNTYYKIKIFDNNLGTETTLSTLFLYYGTNDNRITIGDTEQSSYGHVEYDTLQIIGTPDERFFDDFNDNNINNWGYSDSTGNGILRTKDQSLYIKSFDETAYYCAGIYSPQIDLDMNDDYQVAFDLKVENIVGFERAIVFRNRQIYIYIKTDSNQLWLYHMYGEDYEYQRKILQIEDTNTWYHISIYTNHLYNTYSVYLYDYITKKSNIPYEYDTEAGWWHYFQIGADLSSDHINGLYIDNIRIFGNIDTDSDLDGLSDSFETGYNGDYKYGILAFCEDFESTINIKEYDWKFSDSDDPYWEVGQPTSSGDDPWRGVNYGSISDESNGYCLGTIIDGRYTENNIRREIYTPIIDLTNAKKAKLTFYQWYHFQPGHDGGRIEISIDGGSYSLLDDSSQQNPSFYTCDEVNAFDGGKGFSEVMNFWDYKFCNLEDYEGHQIRLRFVFATDDVGVYYWGWYIDNIQILIATDDTNDNVDDDGVYIGGSKKLTDGAEYRYFGTSCIIEDTDFDAIPDIYEIYDTWLRVTIPYSSHFSGLHYRLADPLMKDIFIEIDWFRGCCNHDDGYCEKYQTNPDKFDSHEPIPGALIEVQESFEEHHIFLHLLIDTAIPINPTDPGADGYLMTEQEFGLYYDNNFLRENHFYRYCLLACIYGQATPPILVDPIWGMVGVTIEDPNLHFPNNYFVLFDTTIDDQIDPWWENYITNWKYNLNGGWGTDTLDQFALTFQHELGHTLGIHHYNFDEAEKCYCTYPGYPPFIPPEYSSMKLGTANPNEGDITDYLSAESSVGFVYFYGPNGYLSVVHYDDFQLGGWELSVTSDLPSIPIKQGLYYGNGSPEGIGQYS